MYNRYAEMMFNTNISVTKPDLTTEIAVALCAWASEHGTPGTMELAHKLKTLIYGTSSSRSVDASVDIELGTISAELK